MRSLQLAFLASPAADAKAACDALIAQYGQHSPEQADVLVALGGDGFMLQTLHRHGALNKPVYGMKLGTVGFLMNQYRVDELMHRIETAVPAVLTPLQMDAHTEAGAHIQALAYNEVSLLRQTRQAAHIRIDLHDKKRLDELIADGVMLATPAGSTAYNFSAGGPILPLGANVLALTAIAPFRPRRWRGAVVSAETEVRFVILDPYKRPVSATADSHEVRDVVEVRIRQSPQHAVQLLFDSEHNLEERILIEQFQT